jgi:hypothetical protein
MCVKLKQISQYNKQKDVRKNKPRHHHRENIFKISFLNIFNIVQLYVNHNVFWTNSLFVTRVFFRPNNKFQNNKSTSVHKYWQKNLMTTKERGHHSEFLRRLNLYFQSRLFCFCRRSSPSRTCVFKIQF